MYHSFYSPMRVGRPQQVPQKYPEDIECVLKSQHPHKGSIFVSNIEAAENIETLRKHGIKAVLSCAKGYSVSHPISLVPHYKYITAEDKQTYDLTPHFQECVSFIKKALQETNILVHCIAGVSRSVSMVIAYLMNHRDMNYQEAYYFVKARRKIIHPNDGFIIQLKRYHGKIKGRQTRQTSAKKIEPPRKAQSTQLNKKDQYMKKYDDILNRNISDNYTTLYEKHKSYERPRYQRDYNKNVNTSINNVNKNQTYDYLNRHQPPITKSLNKIPFEEQNTQTPSKYQTQHLISMKSVNNVESISPNKKHSLQSDNIQNTSLTNFRTSEKYYSTQKYNSSKKGYFDAMNSQLNQKIQAIRDKYEKQRQQLLKNGPTLNNKTNLDNKASDGKYTYQLRAKKNEAENDIHVRYQDFLTTKFELGNRDNKLRSSSNRYSYSRYPGANYYY